MFSCHKPKIYRSPCGCCICGAKSSSSRFTASKRYEADFAGCFRTGSERRSGDICNACVLLVKRWRKLPQGTDRHWQHMLDVRSGNRTAHRVAGQGQVSKVKAKRRGQGLATGCYADSPARNGQPWNKSNVYDSSDDDSDLSDCEGFNRRQRHKRRRHQPKSHLSSFLDLNYWKRMKVCCGTVFVGSNGEAMIDARFWHPCATCRPLSLVSAASPAGSAIHDLSDDNASVLSDAASIPSSQQSVPMLDSGASVGDFDDAKCAVISRGVTAYESEF